MQAVIGTSAGQRIAPRSWILLHTLPAQRQLRRLPRPVRNAAMNLPRRWSIPMLGVNGLPTATEHIPASVQKTAVIPKRIAALAGQPTARTRQYAISVISHTASLAATIRQASGARMQADTGTSARHRIVPRSLSLLHTLPVQRQLRRLPRPVRNAAMSLPRLWSIPMFGAIGLPTVTEHIPASVQKTAVISKRIAAPAGQPPANPRLSALPAPSLTETRI